MRRISAMVLALCVWAAACGGSDAGDDPSAVAQPAAEEPQPADETQQLDEAADEDPAGAADEEAEPLVVSFIITDVTMVAQGLGLDIPDQGDLEAVIEAVVDRANAAGGVGGHPIRPVIRVFNAITDSPIAEEQLCNAITQDDQADVVVLTGQFQDNARPCYAAAGTLMLDVTLFPVDRRGYEELAPLLWSPLLPSYDDLIDGLAWSLESSGWFDGATVGVVGIGSDMNSRILEQTLRPRLDGAGVEVAALNWVDPTDATTLEAGQQQAILDFKTAGVDKVIVLGGSRLLPWMMEIGAAQNFAPAYAMTSYDSPEFNIRNTPELMSGSLGVSVLPGWDTPEDQYPSPANESEALCLDIFSGAGVTYESRANARSALLYCDAVRLLQLAGEHTVSLSPADIGSALWEVGDRFESASVYSVAFTEGSYTGGAGYRVFAFDESCECMAIRGDTVSFRG